MNSLIKRLRAHDINLCADWVDEAARHSWMDGADALLLEAAARIEDLEQQLAKRTMAATKIALEVAAMVAEQLPSNTGMYLDRREVAAAIRALSESAPNPLQEQRDNIGKEGE